MYIRGNGSHFHTLGFALAHNAQHSLVIYLYVIIIIIHCKCVSATVESKTKQSVHNETLTSELS